MREFRRRSRLYGSRMLNTLPFRGLRQPCFFLHMPKCGGTSVAAGLYGTIPLNKRIGTIDAVATRCAAAIRHFSRYDAVLCHEDLQHGHLTFAFREELLLMHMSWGTRLIHGHVLFSDDAYTHFHKTYKTVTLMRDPYERTLSNYRMAVRAGVLEDDLDAWLDGPVAESMAQVYLRYLCGKTVIDAPDLERMESQARTNLAKISLVGVLDDLDGFTLEFKDVFGVTPYIPRYNVGAGRRLVLTQAQDQKLRRLLEPDERLYASARATSSARRKSMIADGSATSDRPQEV